MAMLVATGLVGVAGLPLLLVAHRLPHDSGAASRPSTGLGGYRKRGPGDQRGVAARPGLVYSLVASAMFPRRATAAIFRLRHGASASMRNRQAMS